MKWYKKRVFIYAIIGFVTMMGTNFVLGFEFQVQAAESAKIHYLTLPGYTEAILLECNGKFGMVDSGEDNDYPIGEDERYPYREGIVEGQGYEERVIEYLKSVGVTTENFEFYIGTHPHSDHIGSADEVIREFRPERVYVQEYKDSYIYSKDRLWDNLYCYENLLYAAEEVGASIIQDFNEAAGDDQFTLGGSMKITICNHGDFYKSTGAVNDANDFSLGILVEANGKKAFLAGDMNNSEEGQYAEARMLEKLEHVDILTLGHHGGSGSNGFSYVSGLTPEVLVIAGDFGMVSNMLDHDGYTLYETLQIMSEKGVPLYLTNWFTEDVDAIIFSLNSELTTNIPEGTVKIAYTSKYQDGVTLCYKDGLQDTYDGWLSSNGYKAYFDDSRYGLSQQKWLQDENGDYYYFGGDGICKVGWLKYNGRHYYLDSDGIMVTGWRTIDEQDYYFDLTGALVCGWKMKEDGTWLFYDDNGNAVTGWLWNSGYWYYFDDNGYMLTGKQEIDGEIYFLNDGGSMKTGWNCEDGEWYYYKSSGALQKGWLLCDGLWYFLDANGRMLTGKQEIDGETYYFADSGNMKTGWNSEDGKWYYYKSSGVLQKGWLWCGGLWYFLDANGRMLTGKQEIDGETYYFADGGSMKTGWNLENQSWYYYSSNGTMRVSSWIDGKYYVKSDGVMAVSEWIDQEQYYVDSNGCWVSGKQKN